MHDYHFRSLTAVESAHLLREDPHAVLLDVRELPELEAAAVDGALHIPMNEIPARLASIPRDRTIVCMCHLGGRSAYVAAFLCDQGYAHVVNMDGGIAAWANDVDASVVRGA